MGKRASKSDAVAALMTIPNVGPKTAEDLIRLGIRSSADLRGKDPAGLYEKLCRLDGIQHDICCLDVFSAAVDFAEGRPAEPWWAYSRRRKSAGAS